MTCVTSWTGREVLAPDGSRLGSVAAVLFHPEGARVVGVQVDPGAVLGVFDRPSRYLLLENLDSSEGGEYITCLSGALPKDSAGERVLGLSWDETVVWHRMPVRSASGEEVGTVRDVSFDASTGELVILRISTGAFGDAALGKLEVPRELVRGFDGDAVVVLPGYGDIRADGGAAKALASGAAAVKARAERTGEGVLQVGVAASRALGRSIDRGAARKVIDKAKSLMEKDE